MGSAIADIQTITNLSQMLREFAAMPSLWYVTLCSSRDGGHKLSDAELRKQWITAARREVITLQYQPMPTNECVAAWALHGAQQHYRSVLLKVIL